MKKMKGYDVLARILKMQGVEFISAFPNQPLIESCAKIICFIEKIPSRGRSALEFIDKTRTV